MYYTSMTSVKELERKGRVRGWSEGEPGGWGGGGALVVTESACMMCTCL